MKRITIVGMGPGSPDHITPAARKAMEGADCVAGAARLLDLVPDNGAGRIVIGADVNAALDAIAEKSPDGNAAVLVSGDPGLFSFAKLVIRRFGRGACTVIPGVSSVQAAFAAVGLDWQDAMIISAHANNPDVDMERARKADKIAVLGGREASIPWICDFAGNLGGGRRIFVCENLTLPDERVYETSIENLKSAKPGSSVIALIVKKECCE